jgi:hypothetical protein
MDSLKVSTAALASNSANDATYLALENKIPGWTALRDSIVADMMSMLNGAAFEDEVFDEVTARQLISHAQALLGPLGNFLKVLQEISDCYPADATGHLFPLRVMRVRTEWMKQEKCLVFALSFSEMKIVWN